MDKRYCTKCGETMVVKGKPVQQIKHRYNSLTGEPNMLQELCCPTDLSKWFPQHDTYYTDVKN